VTVSLTGLPQALRLDVVDDGIGFDADGWRNGETVPSGLGGGYGLRATQARLRELGGTLEVESAPGEGTAVSVQVPLRWLR
jgi:signal transduction histidine kinase